MTAENCHTQNLRLFFTPYLLYIKFLPWNIHLLGRKKGEETNSLPCSRMMAASTNLPISPGKSLLFPCKPTQINSPHKKNNTPLSL